MISLTGEPFNAKYLADSCNQTVDEAWAEAKAKIAMAATREYPQNAQRDLDATIRIVHGAEVLADNTESDEAMCLNFERWVGKHYPASQQGAALQ